ncbi:Septin-7 CDC10 protein -like protein [Channa argus]|uniref:Septin-7 CDC10 protein-like protein n=1 Tax=Channa argus TaxID=215402 RepID=A0A6G1QGU8_CHAAH|nr:Septin-7 CDC10 protein -like protein [Channa argus]
MFPKNFMKNTKYEDIISRSVRLPSGSPVVYQLTPKKKKFGTLTRMTVGERNVSKKNKTILLVGETGAGKSTLVNTLFNYTMGVKWKDKIWFEIVEEEDKKKQRDSQTLDVIVYEIFEFKENTLPFSLTIIDTPGYGDTRGTEHDKRVSQILLDLFHSEDKINAVGLVMKASENRLTDRLKNIFDSVVSLFGKDLEENIVALITHSDGTTPINVLKALDASKIKFPKNEKNQPIHFLFNNCQNSERTEETKVGLKNGWIVTANGMAEFTEYLETSTPQKLMTTVEVLKTRVRLTACIQNLQDRIKLIDGKQTEIQQIQEVLKNYEQEMKKNEKFTVEVDEVYKEKEDIKGGMWLVFYEGAVCCKVCEENCHYPGCTKAWYPEHCEVINNGLCTVCTNKCPASDHVKDKWRFVTKTRKVQKTEDEMKEKYEKNKSESEKTGTLLENLEKEMKELTAEKNQLLEDSYKDVVKLEDIALNVESLSTYINLDFLIEKMKEKGDTGKVQKLEEMRRRVDEGKGAGL